MQLDANRAAILATIKSVLRTALPDSVIGYESEGGGPYADMGNDMWTVDGAINLDVLADLMADALTPVAEPVARLDEATKK